MSGIRFVGAGSVKIYVFLEIIDINSPRCQSSEVRSTLERAHCHAPLRFPIPHSLKIGVRERVSGQMITGHWSLFTVHCLLVTVHCKLFIVPAVVLRFDRVEFATVGGHYE